MEQILIVGNSSTIERVSSYLRDDKSRKIVSSSYKLPKRLLNGILGGRYSAIIFEVSTPTKITTFTDIHQLNPLIPKIVIIPSALRPLKVWMTTREDYYDLIHYPEQLVKIPHSVSMACDWYKENIKVKKIKNRILEKLDKLSVIIEAGRTITSTLNLDEVVNSIMDMITNLIRAEAWSLLLLDEDNNDLIFKAARGSKGKHVQEFRLKMGQGIAGWVAREKKPLIVNNVQKDPRFFKEIDFQTSFVTRSILCAPLIFKDKLLAVIEIINRLDKKPFTKKDLSMISFLLDSAAIAIENAKLYNQAEELAVTDELTSLYNARFLNQVLETELSRSNRFKTEVSFIFMDLDYFKLVNDNYGHVVGREVLREVADLMKIHFRETDFISRYGGDEFVIVLPETSTEETFEIAEKMRKAIEAHTFLKEFGYNVQLTASFGIATYPFHTKSKEELILMADKAMFQAKGHCRNMVYITTKENVCELLE